MKMMIEMDISKYLGVGAVILITLAVYGISVWLEAKARDNYLKRKEQSKQE